MKVKRVLTWDAKARRARLLRVTRDVGRVGDGKGYSEMLSVGLEPKLLSLHRSFNDVVVTVLGVRLHWQRSYGGRFA